MILADTRRGKYLSMFLGLIDVQRKTIHYVNCGHVPPVLIRSDQTVTHLTEGGPPIGLFEKVRYDRGEDKFRPGDVLILCTDGITESMDAQNNQYGMERLIDCVRQAGRGSATDIVHAVSADVARFSREGTHVDDKLMIAVKVLAGDASGGGNPSG
jgi:serine phosphatase RsbU (regulator of sigma subunit)